MPTSLNTSLVMVSEKPGVLFSSRQLPVKGNDLVLFFFQTRAAVNRGDLLTANQLSLETRKLANMTIGIGITMIVVIIIVRFALISVYN